MAREYDHLFKLLIIGDSGEYCGNSCLAFVVYNLESQSIVSFTIYIPLNTFLNCIQSFLIYTSLFENRSWEEFVIATICRQHIFWKLYNNDWC
jgi:hypothetical protein